MVLAIRCYGQFTGPIQVLRPRCRILPRVQQHLLRAGLHRYHPPLIIIILIFDRAGHLSRIHQLYSTSPRTVCHALLRARACASDAGGDHYIYVPHTSMYFDCGASSVNVIGVRFMGNLTLLMAGGVPNKRLQVRARATAPAASGHPTRENASRSARRGTSVRSPRAATQLATRPGYCVRQLRHHFGPKHLFSRSHQHSDRATVPVGRVRLHSILLQIGVLSAALCLRLCFEVSPDWRAE